MHWSKTRHESFKSCPRKFFYSEIASQRDSKIKDLNENVSIHLSRHAIVREILSHAIVKNNGFIIDTTSVLQMAKEKLLLCNESAYQINTEISIIQSCIDNYCLFYEKVIKNSNIVYVTGGSPFEFVYNNLNMVVLPELVIDNDDFLQIISWKTGQVRWHSDSSLRLKAGGLVCWARCALKDFKKDISVSEIYLRDSCFEQGVTLDDYEIRMFLSEAKTTRNEFCKSHLMKDFSANPSTNTCKFCQFKSICAEYVNTASFNNVLYFDNVPQQPNKKVFLCHVSEDKENIVRPFSRLLERNGIDYWLDEAEIPWGHSILKSINKGIRDSQYVICFMSEDFFKRGWPSTELESAFSCELSAQNKKVLPLMIADPVKMFNEAPMLYGKRYINWSSDMSIVLKELQRAMAA